MVDGGVVSERVCVLSVNRLFARALGSAVEARGLAVAESLEFAVGRPYVHVMTENAGIWEVLRSEDPLRLGAVVLLDTPTLDDVRRAYQEGAAVITSDLEPEVAADVIMARAVGDVRVPAGILAGLMGNRRDSLSPREEVVLSYAISGAPIAEIAENTHYSDRHVRRILHAVLTKAGTRDLVGAARYFGVELS